MAMASLKVGGREANGTDCLWVAKDFVVVIRGTLPPQEWLSVTYRPTISLFVSSKYGSWLPSGGPMSRTLVGSRVYAFPEHRG